jgi:hypothetical protein
MASKRKLGSTVNAEKVEIKGLVQSDMSYKHRIFVAIGMTGLLRSEWALARYGQVIPCNWQQVEYIMWLDTFAPLGYLVADWRNLAVKELLDHDFEWMVFIDHDVILPPDFYIKLNERILKEKVPIWSGLYFTKSYPSEPIIYRGKGTGYVSNFKLGDKVWCNAVPMGCTVIHNSIFKAMWDISEEYTLGIPGTNTVLQTRRVFDSPRKAWMDPETQTWCTRTGTEDLDFCWNVIEKDIFTKAGWPKYAKMKYPILCDTSIFCRHITPDGVMYPARGEEGYFLRK